MKTIFKITALSATLLMSINVDLYAQQSNEQQNRTFSIGSRIGGLACGAVLNKYSYTLVGYMIVDGPIEISWITSGYSRLPQVAPNIALYGGFALSNRFSLQAELNFMQYLLYCKTGRRIFSQEHVHVRLGYNSLDVPLLAKVNLLGSKRSSFGLLAGPQISIPLGKAMYYEELGDRKTEDKLTIDNLSVFGFTTGLFCKLPVGPGRIVGDLRFVHDFGNIKAATKFLITPRRVLIFSLGYELSF